MQDNWREHTETPKGVKERLDYAALVRLMSREELRALLLGTLTVWVEMLAKAPIEELDSKIIKGAHGALYIEALRYLQILNNTE